MNATPTGLSREAIEQVAEAFAQKAGYVPGKPLDPWLREFLLLALSKEGQDLIASMTVTHGFVPIDPRDVPREIAKLE